MNTRLGRFLLVALATAPLLSSSDASAQACIWGSFDASRINYANGTLVGANHDDLRNLITTKGGIIAAPTVSLTTTYLSGVDVFYTSMLSTTTGALSAAEQTALIGWISTGGTLIVSAEVYPLAAYDTFSAPFGVTNYVSLSTTGTAAPTTFHAITQSVNTYKYYTNSTFSYGSDAQLLCDDGNGNALMVVLEPATGFFSGGRVLVVGDHNMFTDPFIVSDDNTKLADNMVKWACEPGSATCPNHVASWSVYGAGWPGTGGVTPSISATNNPAVGGPLGVQVGNSYGQSSVAYSLLGAAPAAQPTGLGGTLLVAYVPSLVLAIPIGPSGAVLAGLVPNDPTLCGISLYAQFLVVDPGASNGVSFTSGLKLDFG